MLGPDEPRYAAIGQNMARTGDFITPRLWDYPWFEKPALTYWLVALGTRLGLPGELAARAPVAALSLAFCAFVFWWLRPRFGRDESIVITTILATSAGWIAYSISPSPTCRWPSASVRPCSCSSIGSTTTIPVG